VSDPNRKAEKVAKLAEKQAAYEQAVGGIDFRKFPKIPRLNREIIITEKIDGTNAAIGIVEVPPTVEGGTGYYRAYAQSRNRVLTPENDNFGFANWVRHHEGTLVRVLGPGLHFGEWWGVGIGRTYDLSERRFSLFNTAKWVKAEVADGLVLLPALEWARERGCALYTVPVLYTGPWMTYFPDDGDLPGIDEKTYAPDRTLRRLANEGSHAVPGYLRPEGIVVYHKAGGVLFKATVEHDEEYKGARK